VDGKLNKLAEGSDMSNVVELPANNNAASA